jgi:hypothetical protein
MKNILLEDEKAQTEETPENPVTLQAPSQKARPARDSIDDQVDALILRYETSSIRDDMEKVSLDESLKSLNLKFLLEQEEEDEELPDEGPPPEDVGEEEEGEEEVDPAGSEDMTVTEPAEDEEIPDLDVDAFTGRVVRLINNYENLLKIEEAIINRAKNFLDENYGDVFVNTFLENLREKYGLETDEYDALPAVSDDQFAVGAFAGGTGGLGGGGGAT